jgi:hypothetical protein
LKDKPQRRDFSREPGSAMGIRRQLLAFTVLSWLCSGGAAADTPKPPLSSLASQIVDATGSEAVLHGVNVSGMEWGAGTPWGKGCEDPQWGRRYGCYSAPPEDMYDRIAQWRFQLVRVPVAWANIEPRPGQPYNEAYLRDLDHIVDEFGKRGIAVVFSMHQWAWSPAFNAEKYHSGQVIHGNGWPVWLYQDDWHRTDPATGRARPTAQGSGKDGQMAAAREFFANQRLVGGQRIQRKLIEVWIMLAERYRERRNVVGADMINEPYGHAPGQLEDFYLRTAQAIHKHNPDWLLVFEPGLSGPDLDAEGFLNAPGFPRHKAVYSFHLYPGAWDVPGLNQQGEPRKPGLRRCEQAISRAAQWGVPAWLGEFHLVMRDDTVEAGQSDAMLRYMKKDGPGGNGRVNVSWTYWAYQRDKLPLAGESGREPVNRGLVDALLKGMK